MKDENLGHSAQPKAAWLWPLRNQWSYFPGYHKKDTSAPPQPGIYFRAKHVFLASCTGNVDSFWSNLFPGREMQIQTKFFHYQQLTTNI